MFLIPTTTIITIYLGYTYSRTKPIYDRLKIKTQKRGWKGHVHKIDPVFGFSPIPNSQGAEVFPIGPDIQMRYDKHGFRIPLEDNSIILNPEMVVLALGGSFTYGAATYAEDTYPYIVGQYLQGVTRNAGVCSYGLTQMLVLAKRLVPIHKPYYILVQYSEWLVDRAMKPFAPTYFGKSPSPYFYGENDFAIHPPVFLKKRGLPIGKFRNTQKSKADIFSFFFKVGLPLFIHDDFYMSLFRIKRALKIIPKPSTNREKLIRYVYKEIANFAKENGAQLVVVVLGRNHKPVEAPKNLFPINAIIVNAQDALLKHLPVVNKENYDKKYAHWRGTPAKIVDSHPNESAHRIIADEIVKEIKQKGGTKPNKGMMNASVPAIVN